MKRTTTSLLAGLATATLLSQPAASHHGWGGYKESLRMQVTVTGVRLGNPHDRLLAEDAEGNEWNLLLAPPLRNRRFGFDEQSVAVGDELELYGRKHPERLEMKVHCLYRDGEVIYTYRYDNGRTSLSRIRSESGDDC